MSIKSLTVVGAARNMRAPTMEDSGEVTPESAAKSQPATLPELLVKQVPTGLVAAYTAYTAAVVELIEPVSETVPHPDELLLFRWAGFVLLLVVSAGLTIGSYRSKTQAGARFPLAEVVGVVIAAAGWGLVIPESPLLASVDGARGTASVLLIGFAALGLNLVVASRLRQQVQPKAQ